MNHALAPLLKRFFAQYLPVQRGLSPQTIIAYRDALELLLGYAADTLATTVDALTVEALTQTLVVGFLDHLEQVRGSCERTRNARLAAIRTFFAFVAREEPSLAQQCQQVRSIPLKRAPCKHVAYLEEAQMQRLFEAIDLEARTGVRDQALLLLLYNTGARVSEIVGLHLGDLHLDGSPYVELLGKGRKARTCPLWPETAEALQTYLHQRVPAQPDTTEVFLNVNGAAITRFGIRYVTRKYGAKALPASANTAVNPHCIRHTAAMHLLRAGNDISMVSFWLGHADINTTHIYIEIDMAMKRKMIDQAEPPAVTTPPPWQAPGVIDWLNQLGRNQAPNYVQ